MNRFQQAKAYTAKYKSVLLPCRYCGSTDVHITSERTIFPAKDAWAVTCGTPKCDCTAVFTKVKDAVKSWNEKQINTEV